jgi:uncharacterized damage-inducible protein DinB
MKLLIAVCLALPAALSAQGGGAALVKHWETAKHFTLGVANAMPADGYNTKPSDPEMNFGQLMNHIAEADGFYCGRASGGKSPLSHLADETISKDTAVSRLNTALDFCLTVVKGMAEPDLYKLAGPEGKQTSPFELLWGGFTHMAHHRGQAEVYLRVKGIKPPDYEF